MGSGEGLRGGGIRHRVEVVAGLLGRLGGSRLERSAGLAGLDVVGVVEVRVAASVGSSEGSIAAAPQDHVVGAVDQAVEGALGENGVGEERIQSLGARLLVTSRLPTRKRWQISS